MPPCSNWDRITESFQKQYIKNKVKGWVKDFQLLSNYTQDDPQAAYSTFTTGLCSRWTHFQRTVLDMCELFEPLENAIKDQLIPALIGQGVSDAEGQILALPLRHGVQGLINPQEPAKTEYDYCTLITAKLINKIYNQKLDL